MSKKAIIAIVVILIIGGVVYARRAKPVTGTVTMVQGEVTLEVNGQSQPATVGMAVPAGAVVRTGAGAEADVRVLDNCAVRVQENGEAKVAELQQNRFTNNYSVAVELAKGDLLNRVDGLPAGSDYRVQTPTAVCGVRGTQFGVRVTTSGREVETEIGVMEGSVEVKYGNQVRTVTRDQIVAIYRSREASEPRQMLERERQRLKPCGLLNFKEVIEATRNTVNIANLQTIKTDLELFYAQNQRYPDKLEEIYGQPKLDEFNHPLFYQKTGPNSYKLATMGADGIPGTGDDFVVQ